ncbi:hypothetical protein [Halapricum desulfuricans]|uniref:hypothetical protein n=1 Tax=Halapricum desulfuricans TaxID=2841257 RepID=UPI001E64323B|nr:hypothetical protein [Halapricum desulfuricans]
MEPSRRQCLGMVSTAVGASLAGCESISLMNSKSSGGDRCPESILQWWPLEVHESPYHGFSLQVEPREVGANEDFVVELENTSGDPKTVGRRFKFDIQTEVDGVWRSIYEKTSEFSYAKFALGLEAGESMRWSFNSSSMNHQKPVIFSNCAEIVDGKYRFVFSGTLAHNEDQDQNGDAIATTFSISTNQ